jgi:hypothetical protein
MPRFLSQNTAQKLPEKKIPSMAANATSRSANEHVVNHLKAHSALSFTLGMVSMALKRKSFSSASYTKVSMSKQ